MDETKGRYVKVTRPKPTAVPPDGVNKLVYDNDDWETVEVFEPFTEIELAQMEKQKKTEAIPGRVDNLEASQEEITLCLADMIGGVTNNAN